jgi:Excalibur calcium-binding domain
VEGSCNLGRGPLLSGLFAVPFLTLLVFVTTALAQEDQYDCASFGSQESAQAELERNPSDPSNLDADNDGIACEDYDYGPTGTSPEGGDGEAGGDLDCADFTTQEEAQAEYDADPTDPNGLDADDDGIACEELSGAGAAPGDVDRSADDLTGADAASGNFRCELFLRIEDGDRFGNRFDRRDFAGQRQYFDGDEDLLVQRIEECREREVLAGTIPDRKLPDTGGPPLLLLPWAIALVGAGISLLRRA